MDTIYNILIIYLVMGLGFSMSSYIEVIELRVVSGSPKLEKGDAITFCAFEIGWIFIGAYCLWCCIFKEKSVIEWAHLSARNRS